MTTHWAGPDLPDDPPTYVDVCPECGRMACTTTGAHVSRRDGRVVLKPCPRDKQWVADQAEADRKADEPRRLRELAEAMAGAIEDNMRGPLDAVNFSGADGADFWLGHGPVLRIAQAIAAYRAEYPKP